MKKDDFNRPFSLLSGKTESLFFQSWEDRYESSAISNFVFVVNACCHERTFYGFIGHYGPIQNRLG